MSATLAVSQNWRRNAGAARRFASAPGWPRRIGLAGVLAIVALAMLAPVLTPYGPTQQDLSVGLEGPTWAHPFGTDQLGQDVLTRVLYAARVDLAIGTVGVSIPIIVGGILGLAAGYHGRWLDAFIGRLIDTFTAFPYLVLVIAIVAMLGPGLRNLFIAIAIVGWVSYARIVRGETLAAKRREYILAARSLGYTNRRIMFRHLLPNVVPAAIVFAMSDFVLCILAGAALGFLGLGVQPPGAEWGAMISNGRDFITTAPWLVIFPGIAIVLTGLVFSLLGDGTADYIRGLDART